MGEQPMVLGRRERRLPAPPHVVWRSLADPHQPGPRPWLRLLEDEVEPRVLTAEEPVLVVWSSLWSRRPDDVLTFDVRPAGVETALCWTLTTTGQPPDPGLTGHLRHRVDHLLWSDLRLSYGQ
jgi:hypothetical protein